VKADVGHKMMINTNHSDPRSGQTLPEFIMVLFFVAGLTGLIMGLLKSGIVGGIIGLISGVGCGFVALLVAGSIAACSLFIRKLTQRRGQK
jgi:hypothetical protein